MEKDGYIQLWINKADGDLKVARRELHCKDPVNDAVCFHLQQAIEKYLKAFLVKSSENIKKTHNLEYLIEQCIRIDPAFNLFEEKFDTVEECGVEIRYPDSFVMLEEAELFEILKHVEELREFVLKKIGFDQADPPPEEELFFLKYKKGFYDLLKEEGFVQVEEKLHNKVFIHKDGEKLNLTVEEEATYNERENREIYYFLLLREYIHFEPNGYGEFVKIIKEEQTRIPMQNRLKEKKLGLKFAIQRMEMHVEKSEAEIEKICKSEKIITKLSGVVLPIIIIMAFLLFFIRACA